MMRWAVLVPLLLAVQARADTRGVIVQHGEISATDTGPMRADRGMRALSPGRTVGNMRFINKTDQVEAKLCRRFGVAMWLAYGPGDAILRDVEVHVHHPTMTRPDGATGNEDVFLSEAVSGEVKTAFTFDQDWEMVPGTWTWEFKANGRTLATQSFQVTLPDGNKPPPGSTCDGPPLA